MAQIRPNDTEHGTVATPPILFTFVPFADDQLQILQDHFAERAHWLRVLVDVQRDNENEFLLDHVINGQHPILLDNLPVQQFPHLGR